jgi:hypothetical protein
METPGTGHGRIVVENFLQDTHFGHPSQRPYTPIGGSPPIKWHGQNASGGGVGRGTEFEWGVLV